VESDHNAYYDDGDAKVSMPAKNQHPANEMDAGSDDSESNKKDIDASIAKYTFWLMLFTGVLAVATIP